MAGAEALSLTGHYNKVQLQKLDLKKEHTSVIEAEVADILKVRRGALGISIELGPPSWPGWSNLLFVVRRSARTTSETVLSMIMGTRRSSIRRRCTVRATRAVAFLQHG